ncbi:hypothetical protein CP970_16590 [Streptomyces kanamyceticus]|uniref:Lipoprotein n=1 Tax=Streptomyces kanamyceticus TaxID=1967 RepID=A0A5J6GGL2_STRKN|nr:hypothetical protein CP970_16590 [Streptomyces kanamyceticus]
MALVAAVLLLFTACQFALGEEDKTPQYVKDGTADLELSVTGRPTPETLSVIEKALVRLKERDVEGLAGLARDDDGAKDTARAWVKKWGDAAQKPVVVDFTDDTISTWITELRFKGEREPLLMDLKHKGKDKGDPSREIGIIMSPGYYDH